MIMISSTIHVSSLPPTPPPTATPPLAAAVSFGASTPKALLAALLAANIDQTHVDAGIVFLATSITLLSGVMVIDGQVDPQEQSYLWSILAASAQTSDALSQLAQALVDSIEQHRLYLNPSAFLVLASDLNASERLLLLGLGYDMANVGAHFGAQERMYLRAIAQRLRIPQPYQACLEASVIGQPSPQPNSLLEIVRLIHPTAFQPSPPLQQLLAHRIYPGIARLAMSAIA
jgi:uncharacterized tellurite resistance protein B-like protein